MDTIRFDELMLDDRLLRAVTDMGFEEPCLLYTSRCV